MKIDKMRGLPSIFSHFRNEFNKFNNIGARMLDYFYHMTLKLIENLCFIVKTSRFAHLIRNDMLQMCNGRQI